MYYRAVNRRNESYRQTEIIKQAYEKDVDKMDELYATYEANKNKNFDLKVAYEDGKYKVQVVPESNVEGLKVSYKRQGSSNWTTTSNLEFEYSNYGIIDVKVTDKYGNESIKTITQTEETVATTGEMATLNGTLGEKVLSYTVTNPEVNSNIRVVGKNLAYDLNENNYIILHHDNRTYSEFLEDNGNIYIKIYGLNSSSRIDTAWYLANNNIINIIPNSTYNLSFNVRSKNSLQNTYFSVTTSTACVFSGIYDSDLTFDPNRVPDIKRHLIVSIDNSINFDNDGEWHKVNVSISIPNGTNEGFLLIGNDAPDLYGENSYIDIKNIQLEEGIGATEYEPYTETNYLVENTSSLPDITTKKGVTHILVKNTSEEKLAASYTYVKTVVE